jgi:hypothetical protein
VEVSLLELSNYFEKSTVPVTDQMQDINHKYQTFTKNTAGFSSFLYLIEFYPNEILRKESYKVYTDQSVGKTEDMVFRPYFEKSQIHEYLEGFGISKGQYALIYDYGYANSWSKDYQRIQKPCVVFTNVKTYLVLFEETTYNLLRLTYNENEQKRFRFDFDAEIEL